jgi:radical SAM superfamily enzyme YgiQ (UPF0313 family)
MNKPKAVIAVPSLCDFYATPHRLSALGAIIVKKMLQDQGWETYFPQFPLAGKQSLPLPSSFSHLKPYLLSNEYGPTAFFSRYQRFGPSPDQGAHLILAQNPDAVFLSCFAFAYADDTVTLARQIKEYSPTTPVYVGGAGVSVLPEYFQRYACIDAVIAGEAESKLTDFLLTDALSKSASSDVASTRVKPQVAIAANKSHKNVRRLTTSLSRGCPRKCAFCANHLTQGRQFRKIAVSDFLAELTSIPIDGSVHINFEDDNILMDQEFFFEILTAVRQMFPHVSFSAENGMDYSLLDEETLERLIDYGFKQFNLSMASCSAEILKDTQRHGDLQHLQNILQRLNQRKIPAIVYFICGLKSDTIETVIENLLFLSGQPARVGISLFYPVPGLPDFEDPDTFLSTDSHVCTGSAAFPWTGSLTTSQMVTAFRMARYINLAKNERHTTIDHELFTHIQGEKKLYTFQHSSNGRQMMRPHGLDREMERTFFNNL